MALERFPSFEQHWVQVQAWMVSKGTMLPWLLFSALAQNPIFEKPLNMPPSWTYAVRLAPSSASPL